MKIFNFTGGRSTWIPDVWADYPALQEANSHVGDGGLRSASKLSHRNTRAAAAASVTARRRAAPEKLSVLTTSKKMARCSANLGSFTFAFSAQAFSELKLLSVRATRAISTAD